MFGARRRSVCGVLAALVGFPAGAQVQSAERWPDASRLIPRESSTAVQAEQADRAHEWRRVDALKPGVRIVVTLKSGERRAGRFRESSPDELSMDIGRADTVTRETVSKSSISTVATHDPASDGIQIGGLSGAGALLSFVQLGSRACGAGCENDLPGAMPLIVGIFGGAVGATVGYFMDQFQDRSEILFPPSVSNREAGDAPPNRFYPRHPAVRLEALYRHTTLRSALVHGAAPAAGFAIAGEIAPNVSLHAEYTAAQGAFYPPVGAVPAYILENVVPATTRTASWSRGVASRRVTFTFSELIGVHPPPIGRIRFELLAGLGVQGQEKRDYYDAFQASGRDTIDDPLRVTPLPGRYYVLDFESPEVGFVYGIDAAIALSSGLSAVPTLRYHQWDDPAPMFAYGVGIQWRF